MMVDLRFIAPDPVREFLTTTEIIWQGFLGPLIHCYLSQRAFRVAVEVIAQSTLLETPIAFIAPTACIIWPIETVLLLRVGDVLFTSCVPANFRASHKALATRHCGELMRGSRQPFRIPAVRR